MEKQFKYFLLVILMITAGTESAFACRCSGEGTVSNGIKYSDAVFTGTIISKTRSTNYDSLGVIITGDTSEINSIWSQIPISVVSIKVDRMHKGLITSDTITILTPYSSSSCGYRFEVGHKYIVFATIYDEMLMTDKLKRRAFDNKTYWTHQCTMTKNWNQYEENEIISLVK
jgi:hypothetical protein